MLNSWIVRCILPSVLISFATASISHHNEFHQTRQSDTGLVTGATSRDANGNVFLRREVRDLKNNHPDQWNLYLLALESLHWASQDDPYSFYGLAGIHGRPYKTWQDAPGIDWKIGTSGYCPHNNPLFLGWHRPYLALFEQVLQQHVYDVARKAPADQVERFMAAANEFRMPYWEWAQGMNTGPVPDFFLVPTIAVTETDGTETVIYNPLYSYKFKPNIPEGFDEKWQYINETVRWPQSDDVSATSQQNLFAESFVGQSSNFLNQIGVVFRSSSFARFTSTIEDPHGWIHGIVGGGWDGDISPTKGHFWPLEYSSYEPLFMLHHANVDRLLTLYQAAHPDRWMEPTNIGTHGNVFMEDFSTVDANTPLLPFRKDSNTFWTFNDCRDTAVLGYAYPETQRWNFASDKEYQNSVTSVISNLYSGGSRVKIMAKQATGDSEGSVVGHNGTFTDWGIQTAASSVGMPSTFVVSFSLIGLFGSDPMIDVGTWMVLMPEGTRDVHTSNAVKTMPQRDRAATAAAEKSLKGTTSLTSHLIDRVAAGELASLKPGDVVPFLREKLTWNVFAGDGTRIPLAQLDDVLSVEVVSTQARIPDDANMPIEYGEEVGHPDATAGRG